MTIDVTDLVQRTHRIPRSTGQPGDGTTTAVQMDAVLVGAGFKASRELLEHVSGLEPGAAMDLAVSIVGAARRLAGDHVAHNPYFINFPRGVPDTVEFWLDCLRSALVRAGGENSPPTDEELMVPLLSGQINLLGLPGYGTVQHTFAEMLTAHDQLIPSIKDRMTVLHLGANLSEETGRLYRELAESAAPLGEADLVLLAVLAETCLEQPQPTRIPMRESRAVINAARLNAGATLVAVDTVTDVLRIACQASGGDPTLRESTRFRSFPRVQRRVLLSALNAVIHNDWGKLGDVTAHRGPWKRLGERLHPHEHPQYPHAAEVFAVARGDKEARSFTACAEMAFAAGDIAGAAQLLSRSPGLLIRSLDRLLRSVHDEMTEQSVIEAAQSAIPHVSSRVLCSTREHLINRDRPDAARVFVGRSRRAWATPDQRPTLCYEQVYEIVGAVDRELTCRLPTDRTFVVDPAVLPVALQLSGKATEDGLGVLPRGTRTPVEGEVLRFFTYWRETSHHTDFDLSALMLNADFQYVGHVSWTNYHHQGIVYSGDITSAPDGATEFIDIPLAAKLGATHIVPQVHVYSGEGFDEVAESMFGWMTRDRAQQGAPFEARTVRMRSDMRGTGRVALPVVFSRGEDGAWTATWTHLYLSGSPNFNRVEGNRLSTSLLARSIYDRTYLNAGYLVELIERRGCRVVRSADITGVTGPVTFIGLEQPDGLPEGSRMIRPNQLLSLFEPNADS